MSLLLEVQSRNSLPNQPRWGDYDTPNNTNNNIRNIWSDVLNAYRLKMKNWIRTYKQGVGERTVDTTQEEPPD